MSIPITTKAMPDQVAPRSPRQPPQNQSRSTSITLWGVYSVWRRHAKVYQKTWVVNFLSPVTEPIFYLLAFGYGFSPLIKHLMYYGREVTYLQFIAPGIICLGVVFQPFFEGAYGSFSRINYQKTWQAMMTAPLSYTEVFLGDWLWAGTKGLMVAVATALLAIVLHLYSGWNLLISLPIMILGSLTFAGMGMLTAACIRYIDQVNIPVFLLIIPMCSLSGTYFPRATLPPILRWLAAPLPLSSLVDLMRWPLGLPSLWWVSVLWLILLMATFAVVSAKINYAKLVR